MAATAKRSPIRGTLRALRHRLLNATASYLAEPVKQIGASRSADAGSLAAQLLPGDVLLTDGNTRGAALVRRVLRSPWSHVAMYVGPLEEGADPRCIVEADVAAGVRSVRVSDFAGQRVRVLRAKVLTDAERRRLAEWVVSRIGDGYDLALALRLAVRLLRLPLARSLPATAGSMAQSATRFICSSLLAQAFALTGHAIAPLQLGLSSAGAGQHVYVTPLDFASASLFEAIVPAPSAQEGSRTQARA